MDVGLFTLERSLNCVQVHLKFAKFKFVFMLN